MCAKWREVPREILPSLLHAQWRDATRSVALITLWWAPQIAPGPPHAPSGSADFHTDGRPLNVPVLASHSTCTTRCTLVGRLTFTGRSSPPPPPPAAAVDASAAPPASFSRAFGPMPPTYAGAAPAAAREPGGKLAPPLLPPNPLPVVRGVAPLPPAAARDEGVERGPPLIVCVVVLVVWWCGCGGW